MSCRCCGRSHALGEEANDGVVVTRMGEYDHLVARGQHGPAGGGSNCWSRRVSLTERLGHRTQLVGDDNLVTNPSIISANIRDQIGSRP